MWEPSLPFKLNVLVKCWTSFLLLNDSPNHSVKWPLAVTPCGSSGVKVATPSSVPVIQNSGPVVNDVTWKTAVLAVAVRVPDAPVHGFAMCCEKSGRFRYCCVLVTVPWPPAAASAAPVVSTASIAARIAALKTRPCMEASVGKSGDVNQMPTVGPCRDLQPFGS